MSGIASSLMAEAKSSLLMVIDYQERIAPLMHNAEQTVARGARMIQAAKALDVPILATEQYPERLGVSVPPIAEHLGDLPRYKKMCFSSLGLEETRHALARGKAATLVLVGIEAHVCVLQTALHALSLGYRVHVVQDAVSSRDPEDRQAGIYRMRDAGVVLSTSEMIILEWCRQAGTPQFKAILPLIK